MNATIEVYVPRLMHVLYVEDYSQEYVIHGSPVRFTTDRERAKVFEHEDALRISNLVFDYFRSNFKRYGFPKDANIKQEISVYVNAKKKEKDSFPAWLMIAFFIMLFIGMCRQF